MKITGVVKSAEEITGYKGIKVFSGNIEGQRNFSYETSMGELAGQRIELTLYYGSNTYNYEGAGYCWQAGWLNDIREEKEPVDWSKVPVDAKVIIKWNGEKGHFAKYKNEMVYIWKDGRTSWSSINESFYDLWIPDEVELVED